MKNVILQAAADFRANQNPSSCIHYLRHRKPSFWKSIFYKFVVARQKFVYPQVPIFTVKVYYRTESISHTPVTLNVFSSHSPWTPVILNTCKDWTKIHVAFFFLEIQETEIWDMIKNKHVTISLLIKTWKLHSQYYTCKNKSIYHKWILNLNPAFINW